MNKKIKSSNDFEQLGAQMRKNGTKLVQCDGVFDLVHPGHIDSFQRGKTYGDVLYVVIVADEFVEKGPSRPLFDESTRASWVAAIECVDFVIVNYDYGPLEIIKKVQPSVLVKGRQYETKPTSGFLDDKAAVESYGGRVAYIEELQRSTQIIEKIYSLFN